MGSAKMITLGSMLVLFVLTAVAGIRNDRAGPEWLVGIALVAAALLMASEFAPRIAASFATLLAVAGTIAIGDDAFRGIGSAVNARTATGTRTGPGGTRGPTIE